jgi:hypothetical protein
MKVLNRNQDFPMGRRMRGVRAVIPCLLAALALPGAGATRVIVPLGPSLMPGDVILVGQIWF